ncbi:YxcD family protein [Mesobacillus zeae]|uniref:DUF2653 family protein n=1 Tax=Mesobacillus zeae TaxID=1917180 RepID=A0A398B814_9BACI|nr:YxcD family protein [Mesobacillus zeae]RID85624.1 DUF2653 family protein [Mesobacillus zeae]
MAEIVISEQDIVNALCLYTAEKKQVNPDDVGVELMYDDDYGFSAETHVNGRNQILITQNIIEALRMWIDLELGMDPYSGIELALDDEEGIIAKIR